MSATAAALPRGRAIDRRGIGVLALGHSFVDMAQGAVPAMLPFLHVHRGYSYAAGSALVLAITMTASAVQPVFGHFADRRSLPWLLPGGVLLAGAGIALAGMVHTYLLTFAMVALAGVGVGAYHPEAARYASYVSGSKGASGMSLFSVGGNAGFALGPVVVTALVLTLGIGGTAWLVFPYVVVAGVLSLSVAHLLSFRPGDGHAAGSRLAGAGSSVATAGPRGAAPAARGAAPASRPAAAQPSPRQDRWGAFSLVAGISAFRSGTYFGLQAFVPAYFIAHFHAATGEGNAALTAVLAAGAIGTLVAGRLGDRIGLRPILIVCMGVVTPLLLLALPAGETASFVLLAIVGFFLIGNFSTTVVLGQRLLPNRIGIASGVTLGAAIGIGGIVAALLGVLADGIGLTTVMVVIALLPLPALALSLALPRDDGAGESPR